MYLFDQGIKSLPFHWHRVINYSVACRNEISAACIFLRARIVQTTPCKSTLKVVPYNRSANLFITYLGAVVMSTDGIIIEELYRLGFKRLHVPSIPAQ